MLTHYFVPSNALLNDYNRIYSVLAGQQIEDRATCQMDAESPPCRGNAHYRGNKVALHTIWRTPGSSSAAFSSLIGHCQAIHGGGISTLAEAGPKTHAGSKPVSRILAIYLEESDLSMGRDVAARTELTAAFSACQQT
jgi:hypothetical protein